VLSEDSQNALRTLLYMPGSDLNSRVLDVHQAGLAVNASAFLLR